MEAIEMTLEEVVERGRELTRRIAEAEAEGNLQRVDMLLREKDRINRMRRELSHAGR
jgi:uncharacterized membrane protein (DUF106 family)